jgi:hypothetical protein
MATIVNNPPPQQVQTADGGSSGTVIGLIVVLLIVLLVIFFGLPWLRGAVRGGSTTNSNGASIQVPNDVNLKVQTQQP